LIARYVCPDSAEGHDVLQGGLRLTRRVTHPKIVDLEDIDDGRVVVTLVYIVSAEHAKIMVRAEAKNELHIGVPFYYHEECKEESRSDRRRAKKAKRKARKNRSGALG
jgi:hypothetical protein